MKNTQSIVSQFKPQSVLDLAGPKGGNHINQLPEDICLYKGDF